MAMKEMIQEAISNGKVDALFHNGKMHWDDVISAVLIKKTAEYYNKDVVVNFYRSRDIESFLKDHPNGIVADLGGGRYDHHGTSAIEFYPNGIQYAACGKVLRDVPEEVISEEIKEELLKDCLYYVQQSDNGKEAMIKYSNDYRLLQKLGADEDLLQSFCKEAGFDPNKDMIQKGQYSDYLGSALDAFNCTEREGGIYCKQQDTNFEKAVEMAAFLLDELMLKEQEKIDGIKAVKKVIQDQHGPVLTLPSFIGGWQETVIAENDKREEGDKIVFVIFQNGHEYRVSTVPVENGSKKFLKGIKESLRGKTSEFINNELDIVDGVFVHNSGFIGGTISYESALKMAKASL